MARPPDAAPAAKRLGHPSSWCESDVEPVGAKAHNPEVTKCEASGGGLGKAKYSVVNCCGAAVLRNRWAPWLLLGRRDAAVWRKLRMLRCGETAVVAVGATGGAAHRCCLVGSRPFSVSLLERAPWVLGSTAGQRSTRRRQNHSAAAPRRRESQ